MDIIFIPAFLILSVRLLNAPMEPLPRIAILAVSYLIFLYAFDFYSPRQFDASRILYAVFLVVLFAVILSVLVDYALFFRSIGRKILLLHTAIAIFYLFFRGKFVAGAKQRVPTRILLSGITKQALPLSVRKKLSENGTIFHLPPDGTIPEAKGPVNDYVIVDQFEKIDDGAMHRFLLEKLRGKPVMTLAGFYELFFRQVAADMVDSRFFFEPTGFSRAMRRFPTTVKRITDFFLAVALLCVTAPVMLITAILIRLESPGAALFCQKRTGLHGEFFVIYKFRSMRNDAEASGQAQWATEDDPRITKIGRLIRKLRIDELPQLFNVIRGDMSFVGPRPERPEFDSQLKEQLPFYMFRYLVKPGITGWAQVNYGYGASVEDALEKLKYDLYYVKNISFLLDAEILLKTAATVFLAKGR
ncbi:MAG: sugar transferase [Acidobacteria bacterium]|nr:sugar transferase [Acidobacteriota bacterium]